MGIAPALDPYGVKDLDLKWMRQSTTGDADVCLKRIEHKLAGAPYATSEPRVIGTAYHAGLEAYYNELSDHSISLAIDQGFEDELVFAVPDWETSPDQALATAHRLVETYLEEEHYWPREFQTLGVEQEWFLPFVPGWLRKGEMDLVLLGEDGWHYIVDQKSAKKRWKKGKHLGRSTNQPAFYISAWKEIWAATHDGEVPNVRFFFDIMTLAGEFERREAHRSDHEISMTLAKAADLARLIDEGGPFPPNQSSFLCHHQYCDHWSYCPYGESFENGPAETPVLIGAAA